MSIQIYLELIGLVLGIICSVLGIIGGFQTIYKNKKKPGTKLRLMDFKNAIIFLLLGIVLILLVVLIKPTCNQPKVMIKSLRMNELVCDEIGISGSAPCVSADKKIALIVHWVKQEGVLERWFIHPECATLESKNDWKLSNVEIGTTSMKGKTFELYAYVVNDSIVGIIQKITSDQSYHGTSSKPVQISGVFDRKTVIRKP